MTELRRDAVGAAVADTLNDLQTDYLDLLLIHWPLKYKPGTLFARDGAQDFAETWAAMEALVKDGKVRSIGVSNFDAAQLEALLKTAKIKPAVNQIEAHPRFLIRHWWPGASVKRSPSSRGGPSPPAAGGSPRTGSCGRRRTCTR